MRTTQTPEELQEAVYRLDEDLYNTSWKLRIREELDDGIFVNVYQIDRCYGGPEEGGWWYDAGHVIHTFQMVSYGQAQALAEVLRSTFCDNGARFSMAQREDDYSVRVEGTAGADFPQERPHYE